MNIHAHNNRGNTHNRNVTNAFEMLRYMYPEIKSKRFGAIDLSLCTSLKEMYALVIATWCASIAKEGLYKEYVTREAEEMVSPQGQIDVQQTITQQTQIRGALICNYDELSDNIYLNHILKGTLLYYLYNSDINNSIKTIIQKTLQMFNGVDYVDLMNIKWKDVKYNNNTMRYKHLLEVCKNVVDESKIEKVCEYKENEKLYILFKKQMLKYLMETYGEEDKVARFEQPYTLDDEPIFETHVFKQQPMTVISTDKTALVIMIRLQDEQAQKDIKAIKRRQEELVQYLREYKKEHKVTVSGAIAYINTDPNKLNLQPMTTVVYDDYNIGEVTIDIYDQWRFITNKINGFYKYYIERDKNRI